MRDWWRRWPDSNVGVVISDLRVMVLDVDGPLGEVSLQTLLDQAGSTALPETYTVTTGRADGGRHLWYRLTDQQEKLVNQLGANYPQTPHLDVLFQGLVVGAGPSTRPERPTSATAPCLRRRPNWRSCR